jgi:hypothetical protein
VITSQRRNYLCHPLKKRLKLRKRRSRRKEAEEARIESKKRLLRLLNPLKLRRLLS